MGLWTYLCYLISVVLDCGLCFGFWFLCVLWFDFSWVWVGFDFSMCSLGWFLMGMGWFWFLCSLVDFSWVWVGFDFSWIWVLISQLFWVWVFNFFVLYVGHLSAIILHDQSRFEISYFSSFKDIFYQWDPKYYIC